MSEIERLHGAIISAVDEVRSIIDTAEARGDGLSAEESATIQKAEADIAELEAQQRALQAVEAAETRAREAAEARSAVDEIVRPTREVAAEDDRPDIRSFLRGEQGVAVEARDLQVGAGTGGNTVATDFEAMLVEYLEERLAVLMLASRLNTAGGNPLEIPTVATYSSVSTTPVAESAAISEAEPTFGQVTLGAYKYAAIVPMSVELVQDSAIDIDAFVARQLADQVWRAVGSELAVGDGAGNPQGLFSGLSTGQTAAGAADVTFDDLIGLQHSVVSPYRSNGAFVMNDSTLELVRKQKDSQGQYLWQPSQQAGAPGTVLGAPVYCDAFAPAATTGLDSVVYGDIASAFVVRQAGGIRIERSSDAEFENDVLLVKAVVRIDSDVIDANAAKVLTQA